MFGHDIRTLRTNECSGAREIIDLKPFGTVIKHAEWVIEMGS